MYERFEMLLREYNLSVAEFCRQTGMSRSTLSDWKKGKFKLKEDKRKQICQFFGCSMAWLDGEEDQLKPIEVQNTVIIPTEKYSSCRQDSSATQLVDLMVQLSADPDLFALVERVVNSDEKQRERMEKILNLLED